jgi:hypothetical protein
MINEMLCISRVKNKTGDNFYSLGGTAMKIERGLFASAIAVGLVTFTGEPAVATCLAQPSLRADGGHWYYRIDRPTNRKCWYQQTSKEAPSVISSPLSSANSQALSTSPSSASSNLVAWLSSISAAITSSLPSITAQNDETHDPPSAEPAREPSSRSRLRALRQGDADRSHNRRAKVEQVRAKPVDPNNFRALPADSDSRSQDVKALLQEFQKSQEFQDFLERQSVR